jgi:hypothetical protein
VESPQGQLTLPATGHLLDMERRPPGSRRFAANAPLHCLALVSPPVALAINVFARSLAQVGRSDDEDF